VKRSVAITPPVPYCNASFLLLLFSLTAASGVSCSFSTTSPASPMSSVSLTSPLSPFSPVQASQPSPTKHLGPEVSTGGTTHLTPTTSPHVDTSPDTCRWPSPKPRPKSSFTPQLRPSPRPLRSRPKSYRECDPTLYNDHQIYSTFETPVEIAITHQPKLTLTSQEFQQALREHLQRFEPLLEEIDQSPMCRSEPVSNLNVHPVKASSGELPRFLQELSQYSSGYKTCVDYQSYSRQTDPDTVSPDSSQRKYMYPDSRTPTCLVSHHCNDLSYLASKRRFSAPESQLGLYQVI